jgi:ribonucleotide reductase alpha subunit
LSEEELLAFKPHNVKSDDELFNLFKVGAYSSFEGSPASKGVLQFDMWNVKPTDRYDWLSLKQSIIENGLRNSLLVAPMPTASTSQILGFNECFEPFTSNLYSRRTLAGEFVVVNKYLMKELIELGYWNEQIKNNIIANKGSIQQLTLLPQHIRDKYKIVWEMPMKHLIDMAADRGAFICQSQSLNLWMEDPTYNSLTSMHFYSWKKGLKTGIYYLRRKAKHQAQQFTIEPEAKEQENEKNQLQINPNNSNLNTKTIFTEINEIYFINQKRFIKCNAMCSFQIEVNVSAFASIKIQNFDSFIEILYNFFCIYQKLIPSGPWLFLDLQKAQKLKILIEK